MHRAYHHFFFVTDNLSLTYAALAKTPGESSAIRKGPPPFSTYLLPTRAQSTPFAVLVVLMAHFFPPIKCRTYTSHSNLSRTFATTAAVRSGLFSITVNQKKNPTYPLLGGPSLHPPPSTGKPQLTLFLVMLRYVEIPIFHASNTS